MTQNMAAFIEERKSELVDYCLEKAQASWPGIEPGAHRQAITLFLDHLRSDLVIDDGHAFRVGEDPVPGAIRHGYLTFVSHVEVSTISRDFGTVCDAICELASRDKTTFAARDYQTMNAAVDSAIAAAIREFLRVRSAAEAARAAHTGAGLEMRNAISAARVSFDALREGLVGIRSHTADVLGKAIERMEALSLPAP